MFVKKRQRNTDFFHNYITIEKNSKNPTDFVHTSPFKMLSILNGDKFVKPTHHYEFESYVC